MVCFFLQRHPTGLGECSDPHSRSCHEIGDAGNPQYRIHIHSDVSASLTIFFSHVAAHGIGRGRLYIQDLLSACLIPLPPRDRLQKKTHPFPPS